MKVFLRQMASKLYYAGTGGWVQDAREARDFDEVEQAVRFAAEADLDGVEVVLAYGDASEDSVLALRSRAR